VADLVEIARVLVAFGKGIFAVDESMSTIKRCFDVIGVDNIEDNCWVYCEMLFCTPCIVEYISGVILYDETICQKVVDGTLLVKVLKD